MAQSSMNTSPVSEVSRDRVIKCWALQTAGSLQQAGTARTLAAGLQQPRPWQTAHFPGHLVTSTSSNWLRPYSTLLSCIYPPHSRA